MFYQDKFDKIAKKHYMDDPNKIILRLANHINALSNWSCNGDPDREMFASLLGEVCEHTAIYATVNKIYLQTIIEFIVEEKSYPRVSHNAYVGMFKALFKSHAKSIKVSNLLGEVAYLCNKELNTTLEKFLDEQITK